jgi:hypothetical protein
MRAQRVAAVVTAGIWLAACSGGSSTTPTASSSTHGRATHEPSSSAAPTQEASEDPTAACAGVEPEGESVELTVETISYAFDTELIEGPRHCQPFVITFTNHDEEPNPIGTNEHDINIRAGNVLGPLVFDGDLVGGGGTIRYEVPGLPAGEHYFYCSPHAPIMNGTLVVAEQ